MFSYKHQGVLTYRICEGDSEFITAQGERVQNPDEVEYKIRAKIEDSQHNALCCILCDKIAKRLFGISANDLWNEVKKFHPHDQDWKKELIQTLEENFIRLNLIIKCKINNEQNGNKNWVVSDLEPIQIPFPQNE